MDDPYNLEVQSGGSENKVKNVWRGDGFEQEFQECGRLLGFNIIYFMAVFDRKSLQKAMGEREMNVQNNGTT